jgi:hypothetical protein
MVAMLGATHARNSGSNVLSRSPGLAAATAQVAHKTAIVLVFIILNSATK